VLLLRGIAKGEPTARLARELGLSRKQLHTLWRRVALVRERVAACWSRCSVRRKSMVCPVLSAARYRERHGRLPRFRGQLLSFLGPAVPVIAERQDHALLF